MRLLLIVGLLASMVALGGVVERGDQLSAARRTPATMLLGNASLAAKRHQARAGHSKAFRFSAIRTGMANSVHLYVGRSNKARTVIAGIYTNARGRPGRLMSSGSVRSPTAGRWVLISISPVLLQHGHRYWLAILPLHGTLAYREQPSGACLSADRSRPRLQVRWRARANLGSCRLSAYVSGGPSQGSLGSTGAGPGSPGGSPSSGSPSGGGGGGGGVATSNCFSAPGRCGYPDPNYGNVGASCPALPASGSITTSVAGQVIQNLNVAGTITVNEPNVTINNVCVISNGGSGGGSSVVQIGDSASNTVIENSTIAGAGSGASNSVDMGVYNHSSQPATLSHDYIYNCGECIHDGPWAVNDSYVISNGMQNTGEHYEAVYYNNDVPGAMTFNHDVLLNPQAQSGVLFSDDTTSNSTCAVNLAVKNSLVAGGGGMVSWCGKTTSVGSAVMDIENNHFARCTTPPVTKTGDGGSDCSGATSSAIGSGADSHGYWPFGGHYSGNGMLYCGRPGQIWTGNVWDDNLATLPCTNNG